MLSIITMSSILDSVTYFLFNILAVTLMFVFFFFQAEDGIRDYKVTGVQTCALPICLPAACSSATRAADQGCQRSPAADAVPVPSAWAGVVIRGAVVASSAPASTTASVASTARVRPLSVSVQTRRSEERRVGKECRSRWSPY